VEELVCFRGNVPMISMPLHYDFTLLHVVNLFFGDAVDAIENLLIYSTKLAIVETNENESLRAGEINNEKCPPNGAIGFPAYQG